MSVRFTLEYDVNLSEETKIWIIDNCKASMVSPNDDSMQFCLTDVHDEMYDRNYSSWEPEDRKEIDRLLAEGVDYIEILI